MSDLIERLRKSADECESEDRLDLSSQASLEREAAVEIEKLLAQVADMTSIVGAAAVGKSFAEITKDMPRRSGESD